MKDSPDTDLSLIRRCPQEFQVRVGQAHHVRGRLQFVCIVIGVDEIKDQFATPIPTRSCVGVGVVGISRLPQTWFAGTLLANMLCVRTVMRPMTGGRPCSK
jgi:hypothetical protein